MIYLTIIDRSGEEHELEAPTDMNLNIMELCKAADLPVKGTCGGMALCSTCHVYVLSAHQLPETIKVFNKDGSRYTLTIAEFTPNAKVSSEDFTFRPENFPDIFIEDLRID